MIRLIPQDVSTEVKSQPPRSSFFISYGTELGQSSGARIIDGHRLFAPPHPSLSLPLPLPPYSLLCQVGECCHSGYATGHGPGPGLPAPRPAKRQLACAGQVWQTYYDSPPRSRRAAAGPGRQATDAGQGWAGGSWAGPRLPARGPHCQWPGPRRNTGTDSKFNHGQNRLHRSSDHCPK